MKTKPRITILLMLCILTFSCSSDDDNTSASDPVNQLPEATQVGANTAGALVDGEPVTPKGGGTTPNLTAFYQLLDGEYFFNVSLFRAGENNILLGLDLFSNPGLIEKNNTYLLNVNPNQEGFGGAYTKRILNESESFHFTDDEFTGELTITHLEEENRIVSGTFWFDAVNEEGEVVEVREGRFDVTYSQ
mgnify:CR=1 FL=1